MNPITFHWNNLSEERATSRRNKTKKSNNKNLNRRYAKAT